MRDQDKRPSVVLYSASTPGDIAYADLLNDASRQLGIRTVYTLTDPASVPAHFRERTFYLSGSQRMVSGVKEALNRLLKYSPLQPSDCFSALSLCDPV